MAVKHLHRFALTVPDVGVQQKFYEDFGLHGRQDGDRVIMRCRGRDQDQIALFEGPERRLRYIAFGTDPEGLEAIRKNAQTDSETALIDAPAGSPLEGLWLQHHYDDLVYNVHLSTPAPSLGGPQPNAQQQPFMINSPGHYGRVNRKGGIEFDADIFPRRLGHVLHFTPDVDKKIAFYQRVLGMVLSDRSGEFVAFLRTPGGSDHHVLALAKSERTGFHHCSFEAGSPDELGLQGQRMLEKGYRNGWGFGRHAVGSNYFWYIRDPHEALCEYFCDIDYIDDDTQWQARDWPPELSFYLWGPAVPKEFGENYEGCTTTTRPQPPEGISRV
jgi:catechol 2,3-dioxygenase-like lactoylglutathione lyase family enzyme